MNRFIAFLAALSFTLAAQAQSPSTEKVSYYKQIRPILQQQCQGCHQPAKPLGGYIMTNHADLFKVGDSDQPGVVAGKPKESLLVQLLSNVAKDRSKMPKGKDPLPDQQIKLITDWVTQGAIDDTPASAKAPLVDADHPPTYRSLPVVTSIAFSPDGQWLAVSGYHEVLIHRADGSGLAMRFVGLSERVQSLAFSPDGKTLAVCGGDPGRVGEIQLWDMQKKSLRLSIPVSFDTVYGASWSPDGSKVACGCSDNTVRAFDTANGKQVVFQGAHSDWVVATAFSQDGQHLVSVSRDRSVKLTHVSTNRFIDNVTSITPGALKGGLMAVAVRPAKDPIIRQAALAAAVIGQSRTLTTVLDSAVSSLAPKLRMSLLPPDARDLPAKIYDEILTAGADGQPRLYKMHREVKRVIGDDANRLREFEKLEGRTYDLAFDHTGRYFAAGSSLDNKGEARVFETDTGKRVSTLEGVTTPVFSVAYHPNGQTVATAGFDGIVRFNHPLTGKLQKEFVPVPLKK